MKKILLGTLALIASMNVMADDIIVCDSSYQDDYEYDIHSQYYYSYDNKGQRTMVKEYDSYWGTTDSSYVKYYYDAAGHETRSERYSNHTSIGAMNDEFTMTSYTENENFDENGNPTLTTTFELDLYGNWGPNSKVIDISYDKDCVLTATTYVWVNGEWVLSSIQKGDITYEGKSAVSTLTLEEYLVDEETGTSSFAQETTIKSTTTYYEETGYIKDMVTNMYMDGIDVTGPIVEHYTYEFGEFGTQYPTKQTVTYDDGEVETVDQMWYSKLSPANIEDIMAAQNARTMVFDLSGKYLGNNADKLSNGTFIIKDRNGIRKIIK